MPNTELRIMVGMAQGADLLVAQSALDAGLRVEALLPMPLEYYVEDFDADSSATLLSLLQHPALDCTVLSSPVSAQPLGSPKDADRDALYANLTEVLIDKCSLLLALWDGETSPLSGGTADTVLRYLGARTFPGRDNRRIELLDTVTEPIWGPHFVYWIPTPRTDDPSMPAHQPSYLSVIGENLLAVHASIPKQLELQLAELNAYNQEFGRLHGSNAFTRLDSLMPALGDTEPSGRDALQRIDAEYAKADALAVYYQRHSDRLFRWFSYMASSMALLFLVYAKLIASTLLLSLYLAILAISLGVFYWVRGRHWFSKHLIYRVLAETMRTKFFLRAAGADRLVNAAELINLTGIEQFAGFSWIGNLLKNVEPLSAQHIDAEIQDQARLQRVHHHWIRDQQAYFNSRVRSLERRQRRLERMKSVLLYGIAVLGVILLGFAKVLGTKIIDTISFKDVLIFLMGLLPVWLGIWELYQNKMATRELLWQYRNQLSHFTRAELQLSRSTIIGRQKAILAEVGKKSLMESYLWTIHRYHREYEPPAAG
jgi:hypothetical protein